MLKRTILEYKENNPRLGEPSFKSMNMPVSNSLSQAKPTQMPLQEPSTPRTSSFVEEKEMLKRLIRGDKENVNVIAQTPPVLKKIRYGLRCYCGHPSCHDFDYVSEDERDEREEAKEERPHSENSFDKEQRILRELYDIGNYQ